MEEQITQAPPPPVPIVPTTPVAPPSPAKPKTFIFVLLGLVLVAGLLFAGVALSQKGFLSGILSLAKPSPTPTLAPEPTPTPDPTANWKTYTNQKYNYSFKYPAEAKLEEGKGYEERLQETILTFYGPNYPGPGEFTDGYGITFAVLKNLGNATPNQLAQKVFAESQKGIADKTLEGDISKCKVEEVTRGGTTGTRFTYCVRAPGSGVVNFSEWFVKNGITYQIYAVLQNSNYQKDFDQILSTFKFLDQTSSTENWKTYSSTEDNYSVKYPSTWFSRGRVENSLGGAESYLSNENSKYSDLSPEGVYIFLKKKGKTDNDSLLFNQAEETEGAEILTIDGQPAVKVKARTANMSGMGDQERYVIETTVFYKNQTLYALSLESPFVKPVEENEKIYDQILSTFKFTQ